MVDSMYGSSVPKNLRPRSGCRDAMRTDIPLSRRCRTTRRPRNPVPPRTVTNCRSMTFSLGKLKHLASGAQSETKNGLGKGTIGSGWDHTVQSRSDRLKPSLTGESTHKHKTFSHRLLLGA